VTPPLLVGRNIEILAFGDALDAGPGDPGRALHAGAHGIGKRVMLIEYANPARNEAGSLCPKPRCPV